MEFTQRKNSAITSRSVPLAAERNAQAYMCLRRSLNFLFIERPAEKKMIPEFFTAAGRKLSYGLSWN
jgi:hypothetical protein